jgi:hypothetical protein
MRMRELRRQLGQICGLVVLTGCAGGVKFAPDSLNGQSWPAELSARQYLRSAGVYTRNLAGLVGHVVYAKRVQGECPEVYSDANLSLDHYLLPKSKLEPDTTAVERFSDKIDAKANVDAALLTFAANLAANQAAEVVVMDTTTLMAPDDVIDLPKLQRLADQPLQEGDCDRFFIRGAIVTTVTHRTATEVQGGATITGTAFGANGKVFSAAHKYSLDYRLGLSVLPVRREMNPMRSLPRARGNGPQPLEGITVPPNGLPLR